MLIDLEGLKLKTHNHKYPMRGVVVDNNDPEMIGRVKVTIEGILEGPIESLPWINQEASTSNGGSASTSSMFIPVVGSEVNVYSSFDDMHTLNYRGFFRNKDLVPSDFKTNYPNRFGFVDGDMRVIIDRQDKTVMINTHSGVQLIVGADGSVTLNNPANITVNSEGNTVFNIDGNTVFNIDGDTTLNTTNANVNSSQNTTVTSQGNTTINTSGNTSVNSDGNVEVNSGGDADVNSGGDANVVASGTTTVDGSKVVLGSEVSGITTNNSHLGVIDLVTGVQVLPSPKVFGDI